MKAIDRKPKVTNKKIFERLLTIMINAGELDEADAPAFADIVNNTYAENVMRAMA